ncbi:MAG: PD40 domain-containing protein [candidate division Zixibacteria bacterium]|nr:PD40 domain-containing protein [candidate division Zixibacteria bacterium]
MLKRAIAALGIWILIISSAHSAEEARLLRFPDICRDQVVFSHGGDLWIVSSSGGLARRLTTSEGLELFPRFSPDGKMVAFTGQYDGDMNVYVIPSAGGEVKRVTYHPGIQNSTERMGPEDIVMDWTIDGSRILFRSREETHSVWEGNLYTVSPEGGYPTELPLPRGGFASFSADGKKIAYCPIFRDFRTWKRYKGGAAQDVWIYDLVNAKSEKITDWEGTDNAPMWDPASGKIYFNSDRTGHLNLYAYDPVDKSTKPVTNFTDYDVRWPAMGPGAIVFENGGYLYVLDLPNGQPRKLTVTLGSDEILARSHFVNCKDKIQDYTLSPDGNRAILDARGEIFTVPAKHGNTRNLTNTSGANEKYATISPDGHWIASVSDASGEDELYMLEVGADKPAVRLTTDGDRYMYSPVWSPDSKKLAWSDKSVRLFYIDVPTKKKTLVAQGRRGDVRRYSWSPDSRWLAYSMNADNDISQVWIHSVADSKTRAITTGQFDDFGPVWDPEGKYLYFLSNRSFNPLLGNYDFDFVLDKMTEIYAVVLSAKDASPFAPQSDEIEPKKEEPKDKGDKKDKESDKKDEKKAPDVAIDFDGIQSRQVKFAIDAGQYDNLAAAEKRLFYLSSPVEGLAGTLEGTKQSLHVYDMKDRKDHVFLDEADGYDLTPDGKKIIYKKGQTYEIIDADGEKGKTGDNVLDLSNMDMWLDQKAEWKQIFEEGWRLQRDYFYDTLMHGVDWKAIHDKYAPLVDHVTHRYDLTYILGEMIGELATGHTYTGGGDAPHPGPDKVGLLGVNWAIDSTAKKFKLARILNGQNWREDRRSPLTEPGIKAHAGDYVIEIEGTSLAANDNPMRLLENKSGQTVKLTLSATADGANSWTIEPKTIGNEEELRYYDWVVQKAHYTDSVSGGRIGYVHIPDMGGDGLKQFASTYYSQLRKEGMIIDVRWNGGGFVSELIIERLRRMLTSMGTSRNFGPSTYPGTVFNGYMACLCNEHSASDGDIFPYEFKLNNLGPTIGKRTWGGVVGIRGHRPFTDGGFMTTPEFALYDLDRKWALENKGFQPDIDVDYPPQVVMQGIDPQIDRAVQELMKKIKESPRPLPPPPPEPPQKR